MKIIKKETYRSSPMVNMSDDMVRVVLTMTRNEWRELEKKQDKPKTKPEKKGMWECKAILEREA